MTDCVMKGNLRIAEIANAWAFCKRGMAMSMTGTLN
jgi:hypothetical protein